MPLLATYDTGSHQKRQDCNKAEEQGINETDISSDSLKNEKLIVDTLLFLKAENGIRD